MKQYLYSESLNHFDCKLTMSPSQTSREDVQIPDAFSHSWSSSVDGVERLKSVTGYDGCEMCGTIVREGRERSDFGN